MCACVRVCVCVCQSLLCVLTDNLCLGTNLLSLYILYSMLQHCMHVTYITRCGVHLVQRCTLVEWSLLVVPFSPATPTVAIQPWLSDMSLNSLCSIFLHPHEPSFFCLSACPSACVCLNTFPVRPTVCLSLYLAGYYLVISLTSCSSVCLCFAMTTPLCVCSLPLPLLLTQLSTELGMNIRPKQSLTFAKCLEMGLQNHVEEISKVGEVAGKEYAIEQVSGWGVQVKLTISMVSTITGSCGYSKQMYVHAFSV